MINNWKPIVLVLISLAACSYINGKGDAEKFVEQFKATHLAEAKHVTHHCQGRDTDENGYVSCTLTVDWGIQGERPEIIPIECAVNRAGNGCSNEGCRPLATFGRRGGPTR